MSNLPPERAATPHRRLALRSVAWVSLGLVAVAAAGCAAWRVGESIDLARHSEPYTQQAATPQRARVLVAGDSTAVGTGATAAKHSVAGLLGQAYPHWQIQNRARDGALIAEVAATQLQRTTPTDSSSASFDLVLLLVGGNDVIRLRSEDNMRADLDALLSAAKRLAPRVILMPAGNVGNAPFFFAPLSWWMTSRARAMHRLVADAAARHEARYVNLFKERENDPFAQQPGLHASDGLHPSNAGYELWWQTLQTQAASLLASTRDTPGPYPQQQPTQP